LFRQEQDTLEGWRALAFYQIGAVLHDLIQRKPIFEEYCTPYARLVDAVKHTPPELDVPGADADLVALAKSCLVKDPAIRLKLVKWETFAASPPPTSVATIKDRVRKRQATVMPRVEQEEQLAASPRLALNDLVGRTQTMIRNECFSNADVFPPVEVHDHPPPAVDTAEFRAAFPKSAGKGIKSAFALAIRIRLLDAGPSIVEISMSAAVSGEVRRFPQEVLSQVSALYRGPFGDEVVKARIDYALYAAIEATIAHPAVAQDETRPLTILIPERME
jgi:hypothetical protein